MHAYSVDLNVLNFPENENKIRYVRKISKNKKSANKCSTAIPSTSSGILKHSNYGLMQNDQTKTKTYVHCTSEAFKPGLNSLKLLGVSTEPTKSESRCC